jgi:hypothetical protein
MHPLKKITNRIPGPSTEPKDSVEWIAPLIIWILLSDRFIIPAFQFLFFDLNQVSLKFILSPKHKKGLPSEDLQTASH